MKIIILGASQVGSTVAENLASEANDITVVDHDPTPLQILADHLDLRTVLGNASHPDVLTSAGGALAESAVQLPLTTSGQVTVRFNRCNRHQNRTAKLPVTYGSNIAKMFWNPHSKTVELTT